MVEEYMTKQELAAVRDRMVADALEFEAQALEILRGVIIAVEDGTLPRGWSDSVVRTPFHAELQRAADCWASANDLRQTAPDPDAPGFDPR